MSGLYVEIVWSRSSPAYYDFLAVSNQTIPLRIPHRHLSTSLFRFPAPCSAPALSPSVQNKSARYLIVTGPRWKVSSLSLQVSVLLFMPEKTSKLPSDSIKWKLIFVWFSEALEYAADALLEFFFRHAHPPHMSFPKSRRHSSRARKKNIRVVRDIRNYIVEKL